jgi:hypothetical protein
MVLTLNFNLYDRGGYGREKIDLCLCMVSEDPCWCRLEDDVEMSREEGLTHGICPNCFTSVMKSFGLQ